MLGHAADAELVTETGWVVGMWLADGFSADASIAQVGDDVNEPALSHWPVIERLRRWVCAVDPHTPEPIVRFRRLTKAGNELYEVACGTVLRGVLESYGLLGRGSASKRWPLELLRETRDVREALLAGFIDGSGRYHAEQRLWLLAAQHRALLDGAIHLSRSLGYLAGKVAESIHDPSRPPCSLGIRTGRRCLIPTRSASTCCTPSPVELGSVGTDVTSSDEEGADLDDERTIRRSPSFTPSSPSSLSSSSSTAMASPSSSRSSSESGSDQDADDEVNVDAADKLAELQADAEERLLAEEEDGEEGRGSDAPRAPRGRSSWRVCIAGPFMRRLRLALSSKRAGNTPPSVDVLGTAFRVTRVSHGRYYGVQLDGNRRCLLADFVVTHNCSLDRGFMRCALLKKSVTAIKRYSNHTLDRIVAPPEEKAPAGGGPPRVLHRRYAALDLDGVCRVGERVQPGDVLINKQQPINTSDALPNPTALPDSSYRPSAVSYKGRSRCTWTRCC